MSSDLIFQFRIALLGVKPAIWRRIQVPESYSFWDLHVFRFETRAGQRAIEPQ